MESISPTWRPSEGFHTRPIKFKELLRQAGWQIKLYVVIHPEQTLDWPGFEEGLEYSLNILPQPALTPHRPGLAFVIAHQGRSAYYLVVCWWDRENELCTRIFVRNFGEDASWHQSREGESFCVWDMEIMWFEREAYVNAVLNHPDAPDVHGYLEQRLYG